MKYTYCSLLKDSLSNSYNLLDDHSKPGNIWNNPVLCYAPWQCQFSFFIHGFQLNSCTYCMQTHDSLCSALIAQHVTLSLSGVEHHSVCSRKKQWALSDTKVKNPLTVNLQTTCNIRAKLLIVHTIHVSVLINTWREINTSIVQSNCLHPIVCDFKNAS